MLLIAESIKLAAMIALTAAVSAYLAILPDIIKFIGG